MREATGKCLHSIDEICANCDGVTDPEQNLPPLTEDEKHRAFEWLRNTALSTRTEARKAYVALRAWSELKSLSSTVERTTETESETPRTDEISRKWSRKGGGKNTSDASPEAKELYDHSRQLERELNASRLSPPDRNEIIEECARVCDAIFLEEREAGDVDEEFPDNAWSRICARKIRARLSPPDRGALSSIAASSGPHDDNGHMDADADLERRVESGRQFRLRMANSPNEMMNIALSANDLARIGFALRQLTVERSAKEVKPTPDRGDAVNLARNVVDKDQPLNLTSKGIRALADAVLQMDAWIREATK